MNPWGDAKVTIDEIVEWDRRGRESVMKKYSDDEERDEHGRWSGGGSGTNDAIPSAASVPDPKNLTYDTQPFTGVNVQEFSNIHEDGTGHLQQEISGNTFLFEVTHKKKNLTQATLADGSIYYYSKDHYTLYDKEFPEGLTFRDNARVPAVGPRPFPIRLGFDIKFDRPHSEKLREINE